MKIHYPQKNQDNVQSNSALNQPGSQALLGNKKIDVLQQGRE
jgi:hypothetical protein